MPISFFSATVATPGTPQVLPSATVPSQATVTMLGVTSSPAAASAASGISFQAAPGNTAGKSIFIGGPTLSVAAKTGIGLALLPGAVATLTFANGEFDLAQVCIDTDSTVANNEKVFVTVVG